MAKILVCGSYAYDHTMVFEDYFKNHILPEQAHILNVSFLAPKMRREFGGCAGNIAYNLQQLGSDVYPMATVGEDFAPYQQHLARYKINQNHIRIIPDTLTGQAFITTDLADNQITVFHPGAMQESHQNSVSDANNITLGIVSPAGKEGMIKHAQEFAELGIPFIFDPGQGLPMFSGDELLTFIDQATYLALNDYEWQMLLNKTKQTLDKMRTQLAAIVVTKGAEGSNIYTPDETFAINAVTIDQVLDPTGCGDAYRAGLLYGISKNFDWQTTGQLAAVLGAFNAEHLGTQNHRFDGQILRDCYQQNYRQSLAL